MTTEAGAMPATAGPARRGATLATPIRMLALALLIGGAVAAAAIAFVVSQPWLGLRMQFDAARGGALVLSSEGPSAHIPAGSVLVTAAAAGDRIVLERDDLTGQVDGSFGPFSEYQRFMARQDRLAAMMRASELTFTAADGQAYRVRPDRTGVPLDYLNADFWIGIVVGVVSWLVSAAIFVFRAHETSARYLLLSGASMLICAPAGVMYSERELALPETAFYLVNGATFLTGSLFAAALFSLLLYYPRQIAPRWVGLAVVGVFLAWYVAQAVGLFWDLTFARRFLVMCAIFGSFGLAAVHWRASRRDPVARAALSWFILSWVVAASGFAFTILAPQMFGVDTSAAEPYGFLLFILVYAGLAVGIMRYRLFELGEWWVRIVTWTFALVLLAALDMAFLAGLQLSTELSLSLALLICGLVWLPARGWIAEKILRRRRTDDRALFEGVVQIGLSASPDAQFERWREVLKACFDPLRLEVADRAPAAALADDGLALVIPAVHGLPALRLEYARGGRALFSPTDVAQANALAEMLGFVVESRDAYERGVTQERHRIAGDIHDNLGATLLSALHSRDGERKDRFIRETLADLRSIVTEPTGDAATLADALARSRKEMAERLEARGVALSWDARPDAEALESLDSGLAQSLRAVLRELTNNILKHAQARTVRVSLARDGEALVLTVEDDGVGFDPQAAAQGAGLTGLADRAARHGGTVTWTRGADGRGTRVTVRVKV